MRSELRQHSQDEWAIEALYSYFCETNRCLAKGEQPFTPLDWLHSTDFDAENFRQRLFSLIETAEEAGLIMPTSRNGKTAYIWIG